MSPPAAVSPADGTRRAALRDRLAWLTYPLLMGGFLWLTGWGFARGYAPAQWGPELTVLNFFTLLAVEQLLPRHPHMNVFRDRQSLNDMGHGMLLAGLARPLGGALSVFVMAQLAEIRGMSALGAIWPTESPFALQLLFGLLLWTFSDYWVHRSLHVFDRLWWFHAVHHDTPQMHILKSGRIHIGEELINALIKPVPLLLLGAPPEIIVWIGLWIVFDGNLEHSNVAQRFPSWFHYLVGNVQLHNLHHSAERRYQDTNFSGSTPIWDVLFGTFSHPDRCELGQMGLTSNPVPAGLLAQVAFPFRAQIATPQPVEIAPR